MRTGNTRQWFRDHPRMLRWMQRHNHVCFRLENWFGKWGFSVPLFPKVELEAKTEPQ
jgi:hypothetical protein